MKIIAFYLPQFHEIPENNAWWGKGFTEWTNMKKAKPLFPDHYQPRIPLNKNYYDLGTGTDVQRWQCKIAKEHGIYGFCFYHYWFDGHLLLQRPVENYLNDKECFLPFCISWANENWTQAWVSKENQLLISQTYGDDADWEKHFYYLLPFLKDPRYIKINNKPLIILYRPELLDNKLLPMLDCWNRLARNEGIDIIYAYQHPSSDYLLKKQERAAFSFSIEYQPGTARQAMLRFKRLRRIKSFLSNFTEKYFNRAIDVGGALLEKVNIIDYDVVWRTILSTKVNDEKHIPGIFVDWDNTPRRENKGTAFVGASPEKFEHYVEQAIKKAREEYKKDMIFTFAWNEWAEGGILEPTEKDGYGYLNAVKTALENTGEWPSKHDH